jgi:hypothetical protein
MPKRINLIRKPCAPIKLPRQIFAEALDHSIRARGLDPKTISLKDKNKIAQVVRNTLDLTGRLRN